MDVATILLAGRQQPLWLYYAVMATVGSVMGGFVTYRLARKGGQEALERRFTRRKADRICEIFERWGFSAIAIPAFLPPPVPMALFLLAAGAMQYPARKFLLALTLGRIARYMALGYPAARSVTTSGAGREEETEIGRETGQVWLKGLAKTFAQSCTHFLRVAQRNHLPRFGSASSMRTD